MKKIILVSHGRLAEGVKHSLDMITGLGDQLTVVSLVEDKEGGSSQQFQEALAHTVGEVSEPTLIIADFLGGTPANVCLKVYGDNPNVEIISGLSLPVVLAACTLENSDANQILKEGMSNMCVIKESGTTITDAVISPEKQIKADVKTVVTLDNNPIQIVNVRVDERLIHGQVAGIWASSLKTQRFIIANDEAAKSDIQKSTLRMAAPQSMRLSVLPVKEAAKNINSGRYGSQRVFLIFKHPKDVLRFIEAGGQLKQVTIGNMSGGKSNEKALTKSVYVTNEEIELLRNLGKLGVELIAQRVPNDSPQNVAELIH